MIRRSSLLCPRGSLEMTWKPEVSGPNISPVLIIVSILQPPAEAAFVQISSTIWTSPQRLLLLSLVFLITAQMLIISIIAICHEDQRSKAGLSAVESLHEWLTSECPGPHLTGQLMAPLPDLQGIYDCIPRCGKCTVRQQGSGPPASQHIDILRNSWNLGAQRAFNPPPSCWKFPQLHWRAVVAGLG
jgi:hypothetical protein